MSKLYRCAFALVLSGSWVLPAAGQDPLKVGPDIYKLVFENEQVRVLEIQFKPGAKIALHSHPDHLVYIKGGDELTLSYPDGTTKKMIGKPGDVMWIKAESHAAQNTGKTEVSGVVVELKDAPNRPGTPADRAPAGPDPVKVTPEAYKVPLDNERVRVLDVRLKPGGKLAMHAHPNHVVYGLSGGKAKFTSQDGNTTEAEVKPGLALWHEAETHAVENTGSGELHVLDIELKPPAKK
jgi:quercetin dioxygenase-like cupin family protein